MASADFIKCADRAFFEALCNQVGRKTLYKLFEKALSSKNEVRISPMRPGLSGAIILKAKIGRELLQVIKIGRSAQIELERQNFLDYAQAYLRPTPKLLHNENENGWSIVCFSFESGQTLADRISELTADGLYAELQDLIHSVLKYFTPWHGGRRVEQVSLPFQKYHLKQNYFEDFERRRSEICARQGLPIAPPSSLFFAYKKWRHYETVCTLLCTCHGDLHPFNILLTPAGPCAIDFQFTTPNHHFLKDFVLLEIDTILKVLAPRQVFPSHPIDLFIRLKKLLFNPDDFFLQHSRASGRPANAAVCIARAIRKHAFQGLENKSQYQQEYFLGLLRYAISRAGQSNSGLTDAQRCIAIHFAIELNNVLEVLIRRN